MTSTITDAIAEITSASHDNAEHGERGIRILHDFQHLEYGTKLYAHPVQCLLQIQEPPTKAEALAHYSQQAILAMGAPAAHPHHCTARSADGACEECEGHAQAMREWKAEQEAAVPVVLPEPVGAISWNCDGAKPTFHAGCRDKERLRALLDEGLSGGPYRTEFAFTEQQVRALLAQAATAAAPAHPAEGAQADAQAFRDAAQLGLTLRFYGGCAQSGMPGSPRAYEVVNNSDRAAAMREAVQKAKVAIEEGGNQMVHTAPAPADALATATGLPAQAVHDRHGVSPNVDKWKLVDGDMRESCDGLLTYHADAYREGLDDAPQAQADARDALPEIKDMQNSPKQLNLNDRAFWVLGWNECRDSVRDTHRAAIAAAKGESNG